MKPGKLTPSELSTYVFPRCGRRRPDVLVHAGLGQDCAVVDFGAEVAVLSTDPVTGAGKAAGWLAVHVGCNDVATTGAVPVGVLVTLLLAPASAADDAKALMDDANRAAEELGIEIMGGHSEITDGLPRSIVSVTALGRAGRDRVITTAGIRPGDTILLSKSAGLEGTAILAADFAAALRPLVDPATLDRARALIQQISVVPEALAAAAHATAMHDATEGGVIGALAELAAASDIAIEVDLERVPVLPETRQIARWFRVDPLQLVSSGALLIATPDPSRAVAAVEATGRTIATIGRATSGPTGLRHAREQIVLAAPERDALWEAIERGLPEADRDVFTDRP